MNNPEIDISVKLGPNMKQGKNTPIFRYLSRERFLEMVEGGVNVFAHLSMWEDPYEAFLLRAALLHSHEEGSADLSLYGRYKSVYGQCWTYNSKDSDLLWRANGRRGDVVRIKSTVKKLLTSIVDADKTSDKNGLSLLQIGEVEYVEKAKLDRMISDRCVVEDVMEDPKRKMEFFFKKRIGFDDEKEVRAIMDVQDDNCLDMDTDINGSLLRFRICPEELIDEVLVDPCMGRREYEQLICRVLHRCPNLEIRQSTLFKWPNSCYQ